MVLRTRMGLAFRLRFAIEALAGHGDKAPWAIAWARPVGYGRAAMDMTPDRTTTSRSAAALAFGVAGVVAAAAHVLTTNPDSVRLWRETVPLGLLVGGMLGAAFRPMGWRAGALLALVALPLFAFIYGVAEVAMMTSRGEIEGPEVWPDVLLLWMAIVLYQAGVSGVVAVIGGGLAGAWLERRGRQSESGQ